MWWLGVAWAACPDDPAASVRERSAALEAAYDAVDEVGFAAQYEALHADAACVRAPLDAVTVLAWHRARALGEFFEREEIASAKSWAAVQVLDPQWKPPEAWIMPGTPLHRAWTSAPVAPGRVELERSPEGGWQVDGRAATSVPADRAFVLQGFDAANQVVHTGYHFSVAEVPAVDFGALDATARERRTRRMRTAGAALGSVLGAAAVGSLATAWTQEHAVKSEATPLGDVAQHAQRANTWTGAALGLGAASAGVVAVAWGVRW